MKHLDYKLAGKIAFISGGSHGIGFEITKLLGKYGCKVIYCSRNSDRLKKTKTILDDLRIENFPIQFDAVDELFGSWDEMRREGLKISDERMNAFRDFVLESPA